ncbi:MAG: hypothetical protein RLZZ28_1928 [Bacteroidota bacterium]
MKILLADDHTIVRDGITMLLKEAYPFAEIIAVSDTVDLLKQVRKEKWDVIISDISMPPGDSGLDAIKQIKEHAPSIPIIILSMHEPDQYAVRAFKAGAMGYITKGAATNELVKAVNQVISGKKYITGEVAEILANAFEHINQSKNIDLLSNRELEVFKLLATGKSIADIARILILSPNTISTFHSRIFQKMGFLNDMELIRFAVDHKII